MSFKSNAGKPADRAGPDQCEMIDSGRAAHDIACLEPYVGTVAEACGVRVCGACAVQMEKESFVVSYRHEVRFVLVHPEMGVYLGSIIGLRFWSKIDPVDQTHAFTFESRVSADHEMMWWGGGRPDKVIIWPVIPDRQVERDSIPTFASIDACVAAGLEAWDPNAKPAT